MALVRAASSVPQSCPLKVMTRSLLVFQSEAAIALPALLFPMAQRETATTNWTEAAFPDLFKAAPVVLATVPTGTATELPEPAV